MENLETLKNEEGLVINNIANLTKNSQTKIDLFTTIEDKKQIFNLENNCDFRINNCKGQKIRVVDVLIKRIQKPLDDVIVNETTGEIKDYEVKLITILIDENKKSYVTASKIFGYQMINFIGTFGNECIKEGIDILISEKQIKNSNNKGLVFELLD